MDHYSRSALNFFAANPLDRLVDKRRNLAWLSTQLAAANTRFVPVWRMQNLFTDANSTIARLLTATELPQALAPDTVTLLGAHEETVYFALDVEQDAVDALTVWAHQGPDHAHVHRVLSNDEPNTEIGDDLKPFQLRPTR